MWRGFPGWPSDGEGAALDDVSIDPADPAVDELLTALTAEPRAHELEGLAEPLTAFRATFATPQLVPAATRKALVLTGLLSARAAAAAGGVALGLAATAMAVAVSLPANDTDRASVLPAATTAAPQATTEREGVGPDATGPAAHGLCTAWSNHQRNGDEAPMDSPPMRNLAEAAGGEGRIAAYCAAVPHPGKGRGAEKPGKGAGKDKGTTGEGRPDQGADKDETTRTPKPPKTQPPATPTAAPSPSPSSASPTPSPTPTSTVSP
jgi:hypothetical protein